MSIVTALIPSTALAIPALWKRALTPGGTLLAWALCLVITCAGGFTAFAILALTLICTVAADHLAGGRADPRGVRRKSGSRDALRVLCNVGMGALTMALSLWTPYRTAFVTAYAAVMAESLADSLASKLGPLSGRHPVDICTLRPVQAGLSGGVTALGTLSELAGSLLIAGTYALGTRDLTGGAAVLLCGFLGAVFDSVLGSRLQVKYRCARCGEITERETHCLTPAVRVSGHPRVTNDLVNLLSNAFALALALLLSLAVRSCA